MNVSTQTLTRYFILSGHGGGWLIFREGHDQALHRIGHKTLAMETARVMARETAPSEVLVEQRNGSVQIQYAFPAPAEDGEK